MTLGTKYLTEATLFSAAADNWSKDRGFLSGTGLVRTLFADENLSELTNTATARMNLGVRIGYDVQAHHGNLDRLCLASGVSDLTLSLVSKTTAGEWVSALGGAIVSSVNVSGGATGLTVSGGPITSSGTMTLGGVLAVGSGGTGTTSLSSLKQALNLDLVTNKALPVPAANQVIVWDGAGVALTSVAASSLWSTLTAASVATTHFTGGLIVDNSSVQASLQTLETEVLLRPLTTDLASTASGKGASLIGTTEGPTVQAALTSLTALTGTMTTQVGVATTAATNAAASATTATTQAGLATTANTNAQTALGSVMAAVANNNIFTTYAAYIAAGLVDGVYGKIISDETQGNRQTLRKKVSGTDTLVWKDPTGRNWYVDPRSGNDSNDGVSLSTGFATFEKAVSKASFGDTIFLASGAIIRFNDNVATTTASISMPAGINVIGLGTRAQFNAFDKVTGSWTNDTGTVYFIDNVCKFGGAAALENANRIYPAMMYRSTPLTEWKRIAWHYVNEFANDAAARAYVAANPGHGYVSDQTYSGSYAAGWRKGATLRYYVNVGADPSGYAWLVKQRTIPTFAANHYIENVEFFGSYGHDGLIARGSRLRDVEVSYTGSHGCEITGTTTDNFTVRDSTGSGYALHHFGLSANWYQQHKAIHRGTRVINWAGAIWGLHGVDSADGGGGAGVVMNTLVHEDGLFQNIYDITPIADAEYHRCRFINYTSMGTSGNASWNHCVFLHGHRLSKEFPLAGVGTNVSVGGNNSGAIYRFNDCRMIVWGQARFSGGKTEFNRCLILALGNNTFLNNTGSHEGVTITNTVIQYNYQPQIAYASVNNSGSGSPITFVKSHVGGVRDVRQFALTGVTYDEHTIFGGDTGLVPSDDLYNPIDVGPYSTWRTLGTRAFQGGGGRVNRSVLYGTSQGQKISGLGETTIAQGGFSSNSWDWSTVTSNMTVRGIVAPSNGDNNSKVYAYGLTGKLYAASGSNNSNPWAAVTTGLTNNFVNHLVDGTTIWLLGDDGSISKLDTTTNTVTQPVAAGAVVSYKLRGGVVMTSGSRLVVFGGTDDGSTSGGVLQSTDNGVTWATITMASGSVPKGIRTAAKVNGVLVLGGLDGKLYTATDVNTNFTSRAVRGIGSYTIYSMAADTNMSQLCLVLRGSNVSANYQTGPLRSLLASIDCSNADPTTWRARTRRPPFTPEHVAYHTINFGVNADGEFVLVDLTGRVTASTETADGEFVPAAPMGFSEQQNASGTAVDGMQTIYAPVSFRARDDHGYFNAV